jgi:hypothetical protein
MFGPFEKQDYPRAKGAAGRVVLERRESSPKAPVSLAGDVSEVDIGAKG